MVWQVWEGEGEVQRGSLCKINCAALCEGVEESEGSKAGLEPALTQPNFGRSTCDPACVYLLQGYLTFASPHLYITHWEDGGAISNAASSVARAEILLPFYLLCFPGILPLPTGSGLHCSASMQEVIITERDQNSANECI